ncbi:MAG TPA: hypothetical protein VHC94_01880 [Nitrobacter sp.]|jgi:hypothetical protein|nr:hypothetical protein [Nitrobacter sp.]
MGGNIGGHHDPRYADLAVAVTLLIAIGAAWMYFSEKPAAPPSTTAFVVPGQTTRW